MPVSIHGRDYYTVAERVNMLNEKTGGKYSIGTELVQHRDGEIIIRCLLTIPERGTYTGYAHEVVGATAINRTSALECAETSAIGRALAAAGYLGGEYASADEVAAATKREPAPAKHAPASKTAPKQNNNSLDF